jgi:two-component system response regulator CpxR
MTTARTAGQILLIDDDSELCSLMAECFSGHGFGLEAVHDGRSGLARALEGGFDVILLDVMLPVLDGFEVLAQMRRRSSIPVIKLTARIEQRDRIAGLDAGSDDYLPKPFGPEELLARIRAVLRRAGHRGSTKTQIIEAGELRLNSHTREVWRGSERIEVTSIEFDILDLLARASGRIVSRDELAAALYQRESTPYERSIDVHMSHLRKKLDRGDRTVIRTVRGVGYMFSAGSEDAE